MSETNTQSTNNGWGAVISRGFTALKNGTVNAGKYTAAALNSPQLLGSSLLSLGKSALALTATVACFVPFVIFKGPPVLLLMGLASAGAIGYYVARPAWQMALDGMATTSDINSEVYSRATGKAPKVRTRSPGRAPKVSKAGVSSAGFKNVAGKKGGPEYSADDKKKFEILKSLRKGV